MTRPTSLSDLWAWALREHEQATRAVPDRIHSQAGDRDDWGRPRGEAIRGLPFARGFVRYIDGDHLESTACRRALRRMHARGRAQSDEYWIAHAVVETGAEMELARVLLRQSWPYFRDVALRALSTLWELTEQERANREEVA